jgi:hypothetical protein
MFRFRYVLAFWLLVTFSLLSSKFDGIIVSLRIHLFLIGLNLIQLAVVLALSKE